MDAATKVQIAGLIQVALLPTAAVAVVTFVGRKLRPALDSDGLLSGLALIAGLATAYLAVAGWSAGEAHRWTLLVLVGAGLLGVGLDRLSTPKEAWAAAMLGIIALFILGWQQLKPLQGLWKDGVIGPISTTQWVVDGGLTALVVWVLLTQVVRRIPGPAVLGAVALGCASAALATGLTGSALIAQILGGFGIASGVLALIAWRWSWLQVGYGALTAAMAGFMGLLIYAHFYVDVPRPVMGTVLLTPITALVALPVASRSRGIILTALMALIPAGATVWLAWQADQASQAADESGGDSPDYY